MIPAAWTWGYSVGGVAFDHLGPTTVARRGNPLSLDATNDLPGQFLPVDTELHGAVPADRDKARASLHLHGGSTAPDSDGYPEDTFLDGKRYRYENDQDGTTLWYHDHALGITRLNVYAGLAGFYLLRDGRDTGEAGNPLGFPAGARELPIVLQDRTFDAAGQLRYPTIAEQNPGQAIPEGVPPLWIPEFFGDVSVVNGKVWPSTTVERTRYRLRLLNGSNARVYDIRLSVPVPMAIVGTDGGLLSAPVPTDKLLIAPGQRLDLLIDFTAFRPARAS